MSLVDLRGSGSIGQVANMVVAAERNQQDESRKHHTLLRVLKNRFSGETGLAGTLVFDPVTGRMRENGVAEFNNGPSAEVSAQVDF